MIKRPFIYLKSFFLIFVMGIAVLFTGSPLSAQTANFELAERFTTQRMEKMTGSLGVSAEWLEDEDKFWYSYETAEGKNWYFVDAPERSKRKLFDQKEMAAQLSEVFNKPFNDKDLPLKDFKFNTQKGLFSFHVDSINFKYFINRQELVKGDSVEQEEPERWATYSPDSTWIAFAKNHNLYLMKTADPDSTEYQLTDDGERWYSYQADQGDTTSNKRLRSRARWFEDSQKMYALRQDYRQVKELWVIHSTKERPELETYKYPMPGEKKVPKDEIHVFDVDDREDIKLKIEEKWPDQTLGGPFFNDGGIYTGLKSDHLYVLRRNRQWNKIDVLKASTTTGEVETLFTEESKPYFNTWYAQLAVINEGEEFIWWSERSGWGQFYLYDSEGNLKHRITRGHFVAGEIAKIDTTRRTLYFNGYGREEGVNPYYSMLYKIKFDGSGLERLTPEDATHRIDASENGNFFVDNFSRADMAPKSVLRDGNGRVLIELEESSLDRMKEAGWKAPELFKVKAADDATDIYGVMWKPFDFDSTKTYPIITYVYPGPQVEPFPIRFRISGSRGRTTTLAQLGFIVVAMGQRGGSPIRSKYYHNYGYGDLRDYPLADNKYGIEQLAARHSYIDIDRVGIFGHSGGGFMSTAALLTYPDFYDVAVSSAGNHDNNVYNIWWSELHNGVNKVTKTVKDTTDTGEEVEKEKVEFKGPIESNTELVENLKGHLLLVHGTADNNVHPANTLRLADALIKADKRFDMMMLPDKRHGFSDYTPYFERMMWYYFAEHLLGDYRTDVEFNIPEEED